MTTVPYAVKLCRQPQLARLAVVGELDHAGVAELETAFAGLSTVLGRSNLVIDVSALEFCDSAGWHALERCCAAGATLIGTPPCLRRLFYLIKHAHLLPPELAELRGLEPGARERVPTWTARAA